MDVIFKDTNLKNIHQKRKDLNSKEIRMLERDFGRLVDLFGIIINQHISSLYYTFGTRTIDVSLLRP